MTARRRTKIAFGTAFILIAAVVTWFGYGFVRAWHRFAIEERICGAFHPVIDAISKFQESTGKVPTNISQLVPGYIPEIPKAPVAESIDLRAMPDGTNWQLTVHSRITGALRVYMQRSSHEFTDQERRQSVAGFHGWLVFRE